MEGEVKAEIYFNRKLHTSQALRPNIAPKMSGNAFRETQNL